MKEYPRLDYAVISFLDKNPETSLEDLTDLLAVAMEVMEDICTRQIIHNLN